jgi:hypothetical protein
MITPLKEWLNIIVIVRHNDTITRNAFPTSSPGWKIRLPSKILLGLPAFAITEISLVDVPVMKAETLF